MCDEVEEERGAETAAYVDFEMPYADRMAYPDAVVTLAMAVAELEATFDLAAGMRKLVGVVHLALPYSVSDDASADRPSEGALLE